MNTPLSWISQSYPMLAKANHLDREYVIWEMPSVSHPGASSYTVASRTPLNGLRQRRDYRRAVELPSLEQAIGLAQQWADEKETS